MTAHSTRAPPPQKKAFLFPGMAPDKPAPESRETIKPSRHVFPTGQTPLRLACAPRCKGHRGSSLALATSGCPWALPLTSLFPQAGQASSSACCPSSSSPTWASIGYTALCTTNCSIRYETGQQAPGKSPRPVLWLWPSRSSRGVCAPGVTAGSAQLNEVSPRLGPRRDRSREPIRARVPLPPFGRRRPSAPRWRVCPQSGGPLKGAGPCGPRAHPCLGD